MIGVRKLPLNFRCPHFNDSVFAYIESHKVATLSNVSNVKVHIYSASHKVEISERFKSYRLEFKGQRSNSKSRKN